MQVELRERINTAVGESIAIGAEITAMITGGTAPTDTAVIEKMAAREAALDRAENFKRQGETSDREALLDAWRNQPAAGPVPNAVPVEHDANDPTASREYRSAFRAYAKHPVHPGQYTEAERHTLTVASDGAGGYTVPADSRTNILSRLPALSKIGALVTTQPTSRDALEWPRVVPNANSESIYTSAFVGSMVGEQPATTAGQNEPSFGMFTIPMKNARSQARLSFNLVGDAEFDILSFLQSDGALNMALLREQQIIAGTGIGANCKGIITYSGDGTDGTIATVDVEGSTSNEISNTAAAVGSAPKILDLIYAVPAQYRQLPSFRVAMTSLQEKKIRQLIDANGNFLWAPGFAATPDTLLGYSIAVSEFMENGGTNGNRVLLAGAFDQLIVGVRQDLSVAVYQERFADLDQVAIFLRQRFGPGVTNNDAFRIGIV
jgi:HK97 family phage major capsid protein